MTTPATTRMARQTVLAAPGQPLHPSAGYHWSWGPEWQIGGRRGRWAIGYLPSVGLSYGVRVQWYDPAPLLSDYAFSYRLKDAVDNRSPDRQAADRDDALEAIARFDAMALELWESQQ